MGDPTAGCLVDSKFGPGDQMYLKTKADVPAETVWHALKDFSPERTTWWPFLDASIYQVHSVGEREADVTEGTKLGPGLKVWARERYSWDDDAMEIRSTIANSKMLKPGGSARIKVTPSDGGCYVEEWYDRERTGFVSKLIGRMAPRMFPKMISKGRAKTYATLAERRPGP